MSQHKFIFLMMALVLLLTGCQTARAATAIPEPRDPDGNVKIILEEPFKLLLGESGVYAADALTITFAEMLGDSRCPADALCMMAGLVQVKVLVTVGQTQDEVVLTLGDLYAGNVQQVDLHGYKLSLQAVEPYPVTTNRTQPDEYRAVFMLE